jgi:malonyl-CoA/methylmalonyl-CoA synthetase
MNLYQRIADAAATRADAVAIRPQRGPDLTHRELHARVAGLAARLRALGLQPGERVAVQVEKSVDNVVLYLATLRAGGVFLPLNTAYTDAELDYFLGDAEPRLLVCAPERRDSLEPVARARNVPRVETLGTAGEGSLVRDLVPGAAFDTADQVRRSADDLAAILYTSGTTGRSKGAMLSHGNLTANAVTLRRIWGWRDDDVLLHALPIHHVHGLFIALHCALMEPSPILFHERFDAQQVVAALSDASVCMGVPTHYVRMLERPELDADRCRGMRLFISGSAPLLPDTFAEFEARTGHRILERYGMTEAGMITSNPLDGPRIPGTVGPPLPDVSVRVCGEDGQEVAAGEVGVLQIRGPNLFGGYWRMPEKTAEEFVDGWFVTGDLAVRDAEGRVSIVGRQKDLVISGGLNVYPREVEAEIDAVPGIRESAVIGVPHPDFGEAVVALIVPEEGDAQAWNGEKELIRSLRERLAAFKTPKRVIAVSGLPRNAMGKIPKNRLREEYHDLFTS